MLRLKLPKGCKLIAYADDLAVMVNAEYRFIEKVDKWIREKKGAVTQKEKRERADICFKMEEGVVRPQTTWKGGGVD